MTRPESVYILTIIYEKFAEEGLKSISLGRLVSLSEKTLKIITDPTPVTEDF